MLIFSSGSCRLLNTLSFPDNYNCNLLHSLNNNRLFGNNFLGKLHDINAHIQFIKFIRGDINIEFIYLKKFLSIYNKDKWKTNEINFEGLSESMDNLKNNIDNCDIYMFEICSVKSYKLNGYFCHHEQFINNKLDVECETITLDENELIIKINELIHLLPNKKIIFQCHFRPNIIFNDKKKQLKIAKLFIMHY